MENRITEQSSEYDNLQQMSTHDILVGINREDARVHEAVRKVIPAMEQLVERIVERMRRGGSSSTSAPEPADASADGRFGTASDLRGAVRSRNRADRRG